MTDLPFYAVCWQEQGEAWGWEPLSVWFDQDDAEVEMRRLVEAGAEFKLSIRPLRIGVPTKGTVQADGLPETAWGDAIFPAEAN